MSEMDVQRRLIDDSEFELGKIALSRESGSTNRPRGASLGRAVGDDLTQTARELFSESNRLAYCWALLVVLSLAAIGAFLITFFS
jgi:hypothetical protein